ncbi:uncharacterized protein LOC128200826 [Galleria mellonella]|uniref:Uncharacterized protein LOC128200826 n=1 Tax=Galleria mellonella TaxID=7137 RepID=A0ABM3MJA9_GALME|nr:uncharacterized protein LOC128200826 [Galleria mellonella]
MHNRTLTLISFNCKSMKRSVECIKSLCERADIVALQETWLLPHDIHILGSIHDDFGYSGNSAVDTSVGILHGRPFGGVAILWRKSVFRSVSVIKCESSRIIAINAETSDKQMIIMSVYMPTDDSENLTEFTHCLGEICAIVENNDSQTVFILGDYNAHPHGQFGKELLHFCTEQQLICADIEKLGLNSDSYTFISDAHGTKSWLDHILVTQASWKSITEINILYDIYWSDHFPIQIKCNINILQSKIAINGRHCNKILWGIRDYEQIQLYNNYCNKKLSKIEFPSELANCCDRECSDPIHKTIINQLYSNIVNTLAEAAARSHDRPVGRRRCVTGWNKYVREAHNEARIKFSIWELYGKPTEGIMYKEMYESRKRFKSKLKWCQNNQDQIKMDIIALCRSRSDFSGFWRATNSLNGKISFPVNINGINCPKQIANMFKNNFRVTSPLGQQNLQSTTNACSKKIVGQMHNFTCKDIEFIIKNMKRGKSPGHDGLSIEHFQAAGDHLPRVLSMLYTFCIGHTYLPEDMLKTIVVPILKNRTGDVSDSGNYRPISLATITAKVFDGLLDTQLRRHLNLHDLQFGFRQGVSTESAILCLKHTVRYYTDRSTPVYACFLDLSKAFDMVSYDLLWSKLDKTMLPTELVRVLEYWYNNQSNQVRWNDTLSDSYRLKCGVRQGGLTSPNLFNMYVNGLIEELSGMHAGCYIDGVSVNNISYADDMVLLSPSIGALRKMLAVCEAYAKNHGLVYNSSKSVIMTFVSGHKKPKYVPPISLNGNVLDVVNDFKYLGHIIANTLKDDLDIERERRALAVRSNMLARRFTRCTKEVKITLFKAFCQVFYTSSLWVNYSQKTYNALRVQYNNAFRALLGLPSHCSASHMFARERTDDFYAIRRKRIVSLLGRVRVSSNSVLKTIADKMDCPILKYWVGQVISVRA